VNQGVVASLAPPSPPFLALKKGLTCGAHMSSSGRRTIRNMCVQIRSDSEPYRFEGVENGKDQVKEEL
jgi:hypothetical protein